LLQLNFYCNRAAKRAGFKSPISPIVFPAEIGCFCMVAIPLVRVSAVLPFVKFLNHIGSPTDRLLSQAKLPIFTLDNPEALVPLYQTFAFVEQAANTEKIELLGILVGQQTEIADLGLFGRLIQQSLTLYDLLRTIERMIFCMNSTERIWLEEEGERVWVHHEFNFSATIKHQQSRLYTVLLYLKAIQLATGRGWRPLELHLHSDYSRKLTEFEEFANVPLRFNQPTDAIAISKSLLSLPLQPLNVSQTLSSQEFQDYYQRLETTAPSADFAGSLQQMLQSLLRDGYPDISLAAEAAGLSIRSFQRRLAEEHLNYSQMVEKVRFDQAVQLLYNPSIQLADIAWDLGYNDAANFTRAFKRWTGVSPREFRRMHVIPV
jgi:AraC-like DNA-binding protein